jgi:hypothetical protein
MGTAPKLDRRPLEQPAEKLQYGFILAWMRRVLCFNPFGFWVVLRWPAGLTKAPLAWESSGFELHLKHLVA